MLPKENELEWHVVKPNDFRENMKGGEFKPHDIEIIINYHDGTGVKRGKFKWEIIRNLNDTHGVSPAHELYELLLD
jgi:hypothetical protein